MVILKLYNVLRAQQRPCFCKTLNVASLFQGLGFIGDNDHHILPGEIKMR